APAPPPAPPPPGSPFVVSTMIGSPKGDGGDQYRGYQITIGSQPLTITALGRWVGTLGGSVHTHTLGIYYQDSVTGKAVLMAGTNVKVDISGKPPNTYTYAAIPSGIVLWPGQGYYILSFELGSSAGDIWYGGSTLTTSADASLGQAAFYDPSTGILGTFSQPPWVPVNFQYNLGTTGNVTAAGPLFGRFSLDNPALFVTSIAPVVSGTINVDGQWAHGGPGAGNVWTYQWYLDGVPYSPVFTSSDQNLTWTGFDTTAVADGTHHLYVRIYDETLFAYNSQV